MADAGLRGTTGEQDTRFKDKEAAAVKATTFPAHFSEKVDLRKVNVSVLRSWIEKKVNDVFGFEDDVVSGYVYGMLEDKEKPIPDPKKMQVSLLGFMDKYAAAMIMDQLWTLLLSAQKTVGGVPAEFIAQKKAELERQRMYARTDGPREGRANAEDSFGSDRRDDRGGHNLPPRPDDDRRGGGGYRRSPPSRDRDRDRYDNYGRGGAGGRGGGGQRRYDDRPRDSGYGPRRGQPPARSPSPRRRASPPPRRRSPPPPRRRSPSPRRQRERSITPPLRTRSSPRDPAPRRRTPSDSPSPPRPSRGRSRSRTPTPHDSRDSRSRSRSPTITPPRRRVDSTPPRERVRRRSSTPPRRQRRDSTPRSSPPAKRRREEDEEEVVVKKGRGFERERERERDKEHDNVKNPEPSKRKLDGPLGKSKWARDD